MKSQHDIERELDRLEQIGEDKHDQEIDRIPISMTLNEQKLAVCEKLPELISKGTGNEMFWKPLTALNSSYVYGRINWPTEGLQVCHEAEKLLSDDDYTRFEDTVWEIIGMEGKWQQVGGIKLPTERARMTSPTHEQRLEALCRVWWPERFKQ